jgi:RNAse (barnase) inhibitor barstar
VRGVVGCLQARGCDVMGAMTMPDVYQAITQSLRVGEWGRNLDALDDVLRGGMGTPATFEWRWWGVEGLKARLGAPVHALLEVVASHGADGVSVMLDGRPLG